jgi:hypothetical protein
MSFSVVNSVNHLVAEYRRFLLSTYRLTPTTPTGA